MNLRSLALAPVLIVALLGALPGRATIPSPPPSPVLPAVPSIAPGYEAPNVEPGKPHVIGVTAQPFVGISLSDAIGMALLKNPDLAVAAGNRRIAFYGIEAARGAFDVRLQVQPEYDHSLTPPQNPFFAGPNYGPIAQNDESISGGVSGILPNGQQYSINMTQTRTANNEIVNLLNPYYPTALAFTLTQPLLRNAGMNAPKRDLRLAVINANQTSEQTLATVSTSIEQVEDAYWDLASAWRKVAIQEEALREAIAQQRSNIRLARQGVGAPVDAVESGAQVAAFEGDVYSALQDVALLQNQLKSDIADNPGDPVWEANLVPTSPVLRMPPVPTFPQLVAEAMQNRPEIRQSLDAALQTDVNVAYARNQTLPQVDVKLGFTSNGYAGQAIPISPTNPLYPFLCPTTPCSFAVPPVLVGGLGQSYNTLFNGRYDTEAASRRARISMPSSSASATKRATHCKRTRRGSRSWRPRARLAKRVRSSMRANCASFTTAPRRRSSSSSERSNLRRTVGASCRRRPR